MEVNGKSEQHVNDQETQPVSTLPDAPAHCPGVKSADAGKASPCAGCPNQKVCASGQASQNVENDLNDLKEKLAEVQFKVLVMSGKGGVGKSTVTAALSRYLASDGESQVGVVDLDICGPSLATMFHAEDQSVHESNDSWCPVVVDENLYLMSVWFLLSSPDDAVVWRGPRKNGLIKQFLSKVKWDYLDYMVVDTPPGTSDEHLSVTQLLHQSVGVNAVILVTTPQEVSLLDVRKQITFCRKMKLPILGVVENMASFSCPNCSQQTEIFPATTGGAKKMCEEMGVDFLGSIPLDPTIGKACDTGSQIDSPASNDTIAFIASVLRKASQAIKDTES